MQAEFGILHDVFSVARRQNSIPSGLFFVLSYLSPYPRPLSSRQSPFGTSLFFVKFIVFRLNDQLMPSLLQDSRFIKTWPSLRASVEGCFVFYIRLNMNLVFLSPDVAQEIRPFQVSRRLLGTLHFTVSFCYSFSHSVAGYPEQVLKCSQG